jgi:hypothetical protein
VTVQPYSTVRLLTDRYRDRGIEPGAIGVVLEVYGNEAYELEFNREDGTTINWFAVRQDEVEPYTPPTSNSEAGTAT